MVSSENAQKIVLGTFWFVWNCWFWKFPVWILVDNEAHFLKGFDDNWRFLAGHLKITRTWLFLFRGGLHSWLFSCLVRLAKDTNLGDFALVYFEKGSFWKFCLCRCRKHHIFPYAGKNGKIFICTRFGCGPKFARNCVFVGGWVGGLVFWGGSSLGTKHSLFLFVYFGYYWCLVCFVFLFWD